MRLPPSTRRARTRPRGLRDDGEALPPLPKLPARVSEVSGLDLPLISGPRDPLHWVWNRLIAREHPLGRSPLVGTPLRYLVVCDAGIVGALGLGPPAYPLQCRDQWIGWSTQAREPNRTRVIGLSRFLIRSAIHCQSLASCCSGMLLKRVGPDWMERSGIKPLLVET